MRWILVLLSCAGLGCSSSSGDSDAGHQADAGDAGDAGGDPAGDRPGDEAIDGWILHFPEGLSFCTWNALERTAPPYAPFDHKLRIQVRSVSVPWPAQRQEAEVELIERVEVSPDGAVAQPVGPGMLRVSVHGGEPGAWYEFRYEQECSLEGSPVVASFGFTLRDPPEAGAIDVGDFLVPEDNTCTLHPGQAEGRVEAVAENGDEVVFDYRYLLSFDCPPGMACLTPYGLGDPKQATFTRDADQRTVTSYFRLGLACAHHGGPDRFLVIFDTPLDGVHGLTLVPVPMGGMDYQIEYLDQGLDVAATEPVTTISWDDPGHGG